MVYKSEYFLWLRVFTLHPHRALNDLMIARLQFHYNIHKAIFNSENNMKINKEMVKWQQRKTLNALYAHIIIITRTIVEFTNKMKSTSEKNRNNTKYCKIACNEIGHCLRPPCI